MSTPLLYGPHFSYFLRSVRLLMNFKNMEHEITNAPLGDEVPYFGEDHKSLHPFCKIPVLIHEGMVLPETLAIAWYIESQPGPSFLPGTAKEQAKILSMASMISQYVHKAIMSNLLLEFRFPKGPEGSIRLDVINDNLPDAKEKLLWLASVLGERRHIVGNQFTLADAYLIPMLDYLETMQAPYNLCHAHQTLLDYIAYHRDQIYCSGVLGSPD